MDLRITQYSHYFSVFAYTAKGRQFRRQFTEHFIEKNLVKKRGRFRMEPTKVYARRDLETEETCFHINTLERFKQEAEKYQWNGCTFEIDVVPMYEPVKFEFEMDFTPWDNQVPIIEFGSGPGIQKAITAEPGFGKAQTLSSKIRVPDGWLTMGEMKVGQQVVTPKRRLASVIGVFPQGVTDVWRIHFADGRYTDVNPEHLWSVQENEEQQDKVITTREIKDRLGESSFSVPLILGQTLPADFRMVTETSQDEMEFTVSLGGLELLEAIQYTARAYGGLAYLDEARDTLRVDFTQERLAITSIEEREPEATQCIMIDDPEHLYITDDYIVTHNTACSLAMAKNNGTRFAVVTLGGYEDRWIPEFYAKLNLKPEEVRSCCGCVKLYRLLREAKTTGIDNVKAIFISTATLRDFYKNWNNGRVVGTDCEDINPRDLWEFLGIGLVIIDEAHKEIHANFVSDLYSHVPKKIYLTATLLAKMDFQLFIYETFLPKKLRRNGGQPSRYIDLVKVQYNLKDWQKAKVVGGQGSYSHTTYEAWIMADRQREQRWQESLFDYTKDNWLEKRKREHKLLIFSATIEMCQRLATFFRKRLPELVINSFTSGDDYQLLLDSDIIFSTIGKSGTAVDIPNLTQAYLTVAIDSPNANVQALGRLRELKGEKKFPQSYHCFVCMNIDKHLDYWRSKEVLFRGRVLSTRTAHLNQII